MAATLTPNHLDKIGRNLVRWRAQLDLTWCLSAILGWVFLLSLVDLFIPLDRPDRFITWAVLVGLVGGTSWWVGRILKKRFSRDGVAADIERTFPQLDNRLINYLQFSRDPGNDPFKKAYVNAGAPECDGLDFREMRNREAHRRSRITLGIVLLVLALPVLFTGKAWGVALWRTVNPFTATPPLSLTTIVEIEPGDATVLQGEELELVCVAEGFHGHEVRLDVIPDDADRKTYSLGRITDKEKKEFSHRLPKVATGLKYRFRAGDSRPSEWYTISTRPAPAFTDLKVTVRPPGYTGRPSGTADARKDHLVIPEGSEIEIGAVSNVPLETATIQLEGGDPVPLAPGDGANRWKGIATVTGGAAIRIAAEDTFGAGLEEEIPFALDADDPPGIEIVSPGGRTSLPPGERPRIEFRVSDDYGLTEIRLEEMKPGSDEATPRKSWPVEGRRSLEQIWSSELSPGKDREIVYRLVAIDNGFGEPNRAISSPIVFSAPSHSDAAKEREELEEKAVFSLGRVVELQKQNIAQTEAQVAAIEGTGASLWEETGERQREIRRLTRELLTNPVKPLGSLTPVVQKLYGNEMVMAIDSLEAVPGAEGEPRLRFANQALSMQRKILRQLDHAGEAAARAAMDRRLSGLSAMLKAIIRNQGDTLKQTREFATSGAVVSVTVVDAQDVLSEDLAAFVDACRDEAGDVRGNDAAFADTLVSVADRAGQLKIREDMVIAAERLDENKPAEAIPLEERAIANLKTLQAIFESVQLEEEKEQRETMIEAVSQAKENMSKIREMHEKMLDAMEEIRGQEDKNDEMVDMMEEAYEELFHNTKEALLEIPTDLHVFTDLNVANDVVEDIISIFEEIEQAAGSEETSAEQVTEQAYAKEDVMLEMMEEAVDRLDDMEMWLGETPDDIKVTTEAFDREEMPESGIATGALSTEVEDMIGDLLEDNEEMNEAADDSATTHAMPDMPMGWEVMEGDISSFSAKGKSGNEIPDHKEQDGRSNVGRQGMSTGETAAGSGTINEGDPNIEERRTEDPTQSGQVDLDGEADTKATGGGKLATGKADDQGMSGGAERFDSNEEGSWEGMAALMARQADAIYAKASLKNVRVDSLKNAAHHLRQASDAVAQGDIEQLHEHRRLAIAALQKARAELEAGPTGALDSGSSTGVVDDVIETGPDQAPAGFRDQVADYFKALNDAL